MSLSGTSGTSRLLQASPGSHHLNGSKPYTLTWNIPLHHVNTCYCDWFNKEADWPIAGQDKVMQENQTKDTKKKKGGVRGVTRDTDTAR